MASLDRTPGECYDVPTDGDARVDEISVDKDSIPQDTAKSLCKSMMERQSIRKQEVT